MPAFPAARGGWLRLLITLSIFPARVFRSPQQRICDEWGAVKCDTQEKEKLHLFLILSLLIGEVANCLKHYSR